MSTKLNESSLPRRFGLRNSALANRFINCEFKTGPLFVNTKKSKVVLPYAYWKHRRSGRKEYPIHYALLDKPLLTSEKISTSYTGSCMGKSPVVAVQTSKRNTLDWMWSFKIVQMDKTVRKTRFQAGLCAIATKYGGSAVPFPLPQGPSKRGHFLMQCDYLKETGEIMRMRKFQRVIRNDMKADRINGKWLEENCGRKIEPNVLKEGAEIIFKYFGITQLLRCVVADQDGEKVAECQLHMVNFINDYPLCDVFPFVAGCNVTVSLNYMEQVPCDLVLLATQVSNKYSLLNGTVKTPEYEDLKNTESSKFHNVDLKDLNIPIVHGFVDGPESKWYRSRKRHGRNFDKRNPSCHGIVKKTRVSAYLAESTDVQISQHFYSMHGNVLRSEYNQGNDIASDDNEDQEFSSESSRRQRRRKILIIGDG